MRVFFIPNVKLEGLQPFKFNMEKYSPNSSLSSEEYVRRVLRMFLGTLKDDYVYDKEIVSFDPDLLSIVEDSQYPEMILLESGIVTLSLVDCVCLQEANKGRLVIEEVMLTHLCRRMMASENWWTD